MSTPGENDACNLSKKESVLDPISRIEPFRASSMAERPNLWQSRTEPPKNPKSSNLPFYCLIGVVPSRLNRSIKSVLRSRFAESEDTSPPLLM